VIVCGIRLRSNLPEPEFIAVLFRAVTPDD
jgi:hypothetical protein